MEERELAEKNKILEIMTGSYLYGTVGENSDRDYVGVFLPDERYILGFKTVEEVDFSIPVKNENGRNTVKALDRKLYEFRKFMKLAMAMNPNIVEILFVNSENIMFIDKIGTKLLSMRSYFLHRGLKQRFLGYAFSQKHKMVIKKDNYFDLIEANEYLKRYDIGKSLLEIALELNCPNFIKRKYDQTQNISFIAIGDLNLMPAMSVKRAKNILQERIDKFGNREELLTKYGYDVKFAMHLLRLMFEGIELLKTGNLEFPLKEAPTLKDVRDGKWKIEDILNYSYELEKEIESITEDSILPNKPNEKKLEAFTIEILREMLKGENKCAH